MQEIHGRSSLAGNEGHAQAAFLPWHRALMLQFERALQTQSPKTGSPHADYRSVTVPYHDWDAAAPRVFSPDFMGRREAGGFGQPEFHISNPIHGFRTGEPGATFPPIAAADHIGGEEFILRNDTEERFRPGTMFTPLILDGYNLVFPLLLYEDYADGSDGFHERMEAEAHDLGHVWNCGFGHLRRRSDSARDPAFFLLHCQVDRQWAIWQNHYDRFGRLVAANWEFSAPEDYANEGTFNDASNSAFQKGGCLEDPMWPWDGTSGGTGREERPTNAPADPFETSPIDNLWPPNDTDEVRASDMIDYFGKSNPVLGLGACYDDAPYEARPMMPRFLIEKTTVPSRPPSANRNQIFTIRVRALTSAGNSVDTGFTGRVRLVHTGSIGNTSPDFGVHINGTASTADDFHDFVAADAGVATFSVVNFNAERFAITAIQEGTGQSGTLNEIRINP